MTSSFKGNMVVVAVIMCLFIVWIFYGYINGRRFEQANINAIVVDSSDWQKRSIDYYLSDGNEINFGVPVENKITIGDSIFKVSGTSLFYIYRKEKDRKYYFLHNYFLHKYDGNKPNYSQK